MGIKLRYLVLILLVLCCKDEKNNVTGSQNEPQSLNIANINEADQIEIVTWNIENFPKSALAGNYLSQFISGLGADVYLFQEIKNTDSLANVINDTYIYNYFVLGNSTGQKLAIVYNSEFVSLIRTEAILTDNKYYFASKPPLQAKIEWNNNGTKKELTLINVHYKCCGDDSIEVGVDDDEEYRRYKASNLLHDYILNELPNENVIVAGDFNDAIEEDQNTNVFQILIDDVDFKFVDMDIAQGDPNNFSWQGWRSSYPAIHFDHILINKNLFDEYLNGSTVNSIKAEEYFDNGSSDYDEYLSDHRPVYFQFVP